MPLPPALDALASYRQFITYELIPTQGKKFDKIPSDWRTGKVGIDAHDPQYHTDYATAAATGKPVAFVLREDDPFYCLDVDGCLQADGTWNPVVAWLQQVFPGAACEVSQSGIGLHFWGRYTALPAHGCINTKLAPGVKLELYSKRRFIALGRDDATGSIDVDCTERLAWLIPHYFSPGAGSEAATGLTSGPVEGWKGSVDDEELIRRACNASSTAAAFGGKARFVELWECDIEALARAFPADPNSKSGLPYDGSSADSALAVHLCYWTGADGERIVRLMKMSGLYRDKYERPDYLPRTVANATAFWRQHGSRVCVDTPAAIREDDSEGPAGTAPVPRRGIPQAQHLVTDQRNAQRIADAFGGQIMVAAGRWYVWSGRHWVPDDDEVYRFACQLSAIIREEAKALTDGGDGKIVKALMDWAKKSEMTHTMNAAIGLAKKLLAIDAARLDQDQWALNCLNGTVDLRTGELRPHDPDNLITRLVPLEYDLVATAPLFRSALVKITLEEGQASAPLAEFLQRWFGYCATGSTREQKFVVHYGQGRNGKSTLLDAVAGVLGGYAGTAAPNLLISGRGDRHPTEIADLFGRRLVTAHESGDDGILREDFVKQATGGDRMKARYMRADFFEFSPTHKLQLVTNHKPVIRGQDEGIWRRVLLMPYHARFGTPEEVAAGTASHVRDTRLLEHLRAERQGILTWIVQGAMQWFRDGLNPPDAVLAASREYQTEQDRVLSFVSECCELGIAHEAVLAGEFGGLYPAYERWCRESGIHALGKTKFVQALERVVPGYKKGSKKITIPGGGRRDVVKISGIKLLGVGSVGQIH